MDFVMFLYMDMHMFSPKWNVYIDVIVYIDFSSDENS